MFENIGDTELKLYHWIFAGTAILAGCGTPFEQCVARAERDVRVLDRLITDVEANIRRGYAIERESYTIQVASICIIGEDKDGKDIKEPCLRAETRFRDKPVAIDLDAERAKLSSMKEKRTQSARAAQANIESCRIQYPEE